MHSRHTCLMVCGLLLASFSALAVGPPAGRAEIAPRVQEDLEREGVADVLVIFRERPDLRAARFLPTRAARGRYVHEALTEAARRSQRGVRARLDARGISYKAHYLGNLIRVQVDASLLEELASHPTVERIDSDAPASLQEPVPESVESIAGIEWNLGQVGADTLWALGHTGVGAVVGIADTGVVWDHPALKNQYRGWNGSSASHDTHWHDAVTGSTSPVDPHSHGTHVTGIMIGDDGGANQIGVAPGARWIACRNMSVSGVGTPGSYTECFEWFMAPYPAGGDPMLDGDPALAPDVINNSWSCPPSEGCDHDTLRTIVESVRAAGILVVAAAGNSGPGCSSISAPPALYDATFSVGATDSSDVIAGFSARGPISIDGSGRTKPDLSAPGVAVRSSVPGDAYAIFNGTSMASPHVAGLVALLRSAVPALEGRPDLMEAMLLAGARPQVAPAACGIEAPGAVPNNTFGAGIASGPDSLSSDPDLDGVPVASDNCPELANTSQADLDGDGTGDACDCAPDDSAVFQTPTLLSLLMEAGGQALSWLPGSGAISHDVYGATLTGGTPPVFTCDVSGIPGPPVNLPNAPPAGTIWSYLVTGTNCFGEAPRGTASDGSPRTFLSCP